MQKLELVDDVHQWKKWWSMRFIIIAGALEGVKLGWTTLPSEWVQALPLWVPHYLGITTIAALALAGAGRVVKQKDINGPVN